MFIFLKIVITNLIKKKNKYDSKKEAILICL